MNRLDGKVAVLAGGAGGIGGATARRLAREGAKVVIGDLNIIDAEHIAAQIRASGGDAVAQALDIADEASINALFQRAVNEYAGVDAAHANAAALSDLYRDTNVLDIDLDYWDHSLRINLKGYVMVTRAALPLMLKRGGGAIVYTSSGAAFAGEPERIAYAAAKSGVNALTRHVASAWGRQNIRANAISPGLVTSPTVMALPQEFRDANLAANRSVRLGEADDIAAMVAMLMSADGEWIQGQILTVDGGQILR